MEKQHYATDPFLKENLGGGGSRGEGNLEGVVGDTR